MTFLKKNNIPCPADSLKALHSVSEGVIDASSIIYMSKAGFMDTVQRHLVLHTSPMLLDEVGCSSTGLVLHNDFSPSITADRQCLLLAARLALPLISEDKKLLLHASKKGLEYYNALMILNVLLLRKTISLRRFLKLRDRLLSVARYSSAVIDYAWSISVLITGDLSVVT